MKLYSWKSWYDLNEISLGYSEAGSPVSINTPRRENPFCLSYQYTSRIANWNFISLVSHSSKSGCELIELNVSCFLYVVFFCRENTVAM